MSALPVPMTALQANMTVGDLEGNSAIILDGARHSAAMNASLMVTSEMALVGYTAEDMLLRPSFIARVHECLQLLARALPSDIAVLVGAPLLHNDACYNGAVLLHHGTVGDCVFKHRLANEGVFDEKRVFTAAPHDQKPLTIGEHCFGVLICEDLWGEKRAAFLHTQGAELLVSMNASPHECGKQQRRRQVARQRVEQTGLPLVYVNQWGGQDELVFDGNSFCLAGDGRLLWHGQAWHDDLMPSSFETHTAEPHQDELAMDYHAVMIAIRDYVGKSGYRSVVLGLSGGLDSALTATLAVDALGAGQVHAIILPSVVTSPQTLTDAQAMAENLGVTSSIINIHEAYEAFLQSYGGLDEHSVAAQNLQARIRATLLMMYANDNNALLLATSNKSESAVGYTTLYGDMSGAFAPLKDVYKTRVRLLARYRNEHHPQNGLGKKGTVIADAILTKPPSAELIPQQKDEDDLMPYDRLDAILHGFLEQNSPLDDLVKRGISKQDAIRVRHLLLRSEHKRRQSPPGVKVTSCHLGRDRRYPIINGGEDFL